MTEPAPEIGHAATLRVRDSCLCLHAQRAARALARHFDDILRPVGLTNGQFSLMMALNRPEPPVMGQVADLLAMDRTTLTACLKPLVGRGLVTASVDDRDHRRRRIALTRSGRQLLAAAYPVWQAAHDALEGRLRAHDPERLRDGLLALGRL